MMRNIKFFLLKILIWLEKRFMQEEHKHVRVVLIKFVLDVLVLLQIWIGILQMVFLFSNHKSWQKNWNKRFFQENIFLLLVLRQLSLVKNFINILHYPLERFRFLKLETLKIWLSTLFLKRLLKLRNLMMIPHITHISAHRDSL